MAGEGTVVDQVEGIELSVAEEETVRPETAGSAGVLGNSVEAPLEVGHTGVHQYLQRVGWAEVGVEAQVTQPRLSANVMDVQGADAHLIGVVQ